MRSLPEEPVFDTIRKAVFEVWTQEYPEAAIAGIPSLAAGHGRDLAAATVVDTARHHNADNSEARQAKLRQLIGLICNPKLRKQIEEDDNMKTSTGDPFADPFAR